MTHMRFSWWIVLCVVLHTRPCLSAASTSGELLVHVAPWSWKTAQPLARVPLNWTSVACGSAESPCASLHDALLVAERLQEKQWRRQLGTSRPVARIQLLSNATSGCRILLRRMSCSEDAVPVQTQYPRFTGPQRAQNLIVPIDGRNCSSEHILLGVRISRRELANLVIDGEHLAGGCDKSVLLPPLRLFRDPPRNKFPLLLIQSSSYVALRHLQLDRKALASVGGPDRSHYNELLQITDCSLVRLVNCTFKSDYKWRNSSLKGSVSISNSIFVVIEQCFFEGNPNREKYSWFTYVQQQERKFDADRNPPTLEIVFNMFGRHLKLSNGQWCLQADGIAAFKHFYDSSGQPYDSQAQVCLQKQLVNGARSRAGNVTSHCLIFDAMTCPPLVALRRSYFTSNGVYFERSTPHYDLRVIRPEKATGLALTVKVSSGVENLIALEDCTIANNTVPFGTAVLLDFVEYPDAFKVSRRGQARVQIVNSVFSNNSGLYGGGLMVGLHNSVKAGSQEAVSNYLVVKSSVFQNNNGSKEGGALTIHDISPVNSRNCFQFVNVTFIGNAAGMFLFPQRGGAVFIKTVLPLTMLSRNGFLQPAVWDDQFCANKEESVKIRLHDSKFYNNTGVGAVHALKSQLFFSGDR